MLRVRERQIALLVLFLAFFLAAAPARAQWLVDGAVVCDSAGTQSGATVIPDGAGGTIIAWQDDRYDTLTEVFAQRFNNAGVAQWKAGGVPLGARVASGFPFTASSLISDGNNGFIIGWSDSRANPGSVVHLQRFTMNGQVDPQWPVGGVALADSGYGVGPPSLVADGSGGAIAVWEDARDTSDSIAEDIYAQRVNGNGVPQWHSGGVPLCKRPGLQYLPEATSDGAGGAWATWNDDTGDRICAQHVNGSGVTQFDSTGVVLCDSLNLYRIGVQICPDGSGGAVVAWYDDRSGSTDIYARRVNSAGTPMWTANGVNICSDAAAQHWPAIAKGGAGDYVVVWVDFRGGTRDLYAQKVTSTGTTSWTANGVRVGRNSGDSPPVAVSDGSGGAYLAWDNYGGGVCFVSLDVGLAYGQHVTSSGAVATGWPADGRSMSGLPGARYSPVVANDGTGSCVIVWHDGRNGTDCNIYAQRIGGGGEPVSVDGLSAARGLALSPPQPNPARARTSFDFRLVSPGLVRLEVVSPSGRLIRELASGAFAAGPHSIVWDGRDQGGARAAAGFYLVRLQAGGEHVSRPLVLLP